MVVAGPQHIDKSIHQGEATVGVPSEWWRLMEGWVAKCQYLPFHSILCVTLGSATPKWTSTTVDRWVITLSAMAETENEGKKLKLKDDENKMRKSRKTQEQSTKNHSETVRDNIQEKSLRSHEGSHQDGVKQNLRCRSSLHPRRTCNRLRLQKSTSDKLTSSLFVGIKTIHSKLYKKSKHQ